MLKRSAVPSLLHTADPARNGFVVVREDKGRSLSAGDSALSSNRDSLSEQEAPQISRMSPALAHRFELGLAVVSNPKIKGLFQENLQKVLCDQGLPEFIKHLLVDKMGAMERILGSMALRSPDTLLLDSNGVSHFIKYEEASRELKANLIKDKDTAGVTFSGRNLKLFSWCQAELKETVHPVVHFLLERLDLGSRKNAVAKFEVLADISNLLILQIACGDDISDNIQDASLVPTFVYIPIEDKIRIDMEIPTRAESRDFVASQRDGIFLDYYDVAVAIWDDIIIQLRDLFGDSWSGVQPGFLSVHEKVMGSLTYSIFMNEQSFDETITQATILEHLAPNMMVECFRFLEKSLAQQIAVEHGISLPESDLTLCDEIVAQSQTSASLANATATAAREMRENDISNPIPFKLNTLYMDNLALKNLTLPQKFESFLTENGYRNHFFEQYYGEESPPEGFDCLHLLVTRKTAMITLLNQLNGLPVKDLVVPPSDYAMDSLARETIAALASSKNVTACSHGRILVKLTRHIELIDRFFDDILAETKVEEHLFQKWAEDVSKMNTDAEAISDVSLRAHAKTYVSSWEDFLCMYLLFKRAFDGTI